MSASPPIWLNSSYTVPLVKYGCAFPICSFLHDSHVAGSLKKRRGLDIGLNLPVKKLVRGYLVSACSSTFEESMMTVPHREEESEDETMTQDG